MPFTTSRPRACFIAAPGKALGSSPPQSPPSAESATHRSLDTDLAGGRDGVVLQPPR